MTTENEVVKEYRAIKQDYAYDSDIMSKDDERVAKLKKIIDTKLSLVDKTINLLYVNCESYGKLGAKRHLRHMAVRREIVGIKNIILKEY